LAGNIGGGTKRWLNEQERQKEMQAAKVVSKTVEAICFHWWGGGFLRLFFYRNNLREKKPGNCCRRKMKQLNKP
jgi:hypothetical protein